MKRRTFFTSALAGAVLLAASGCSGQTGTGTSTSAAGGGTLSLASYSVPTSFAPGEMPTGGPESHYYQAVYDSLLNLDEKGEPVPNLVKTWSYDSAQTSLKLELRDDVKFTDGAALDGEAVKANIEAAKKGKGEAGSALKAVDQVQVQDPTHVTLSLTAPDPALLLSLGRSSGFMASPQSLSSPDLKTTPIGSGPYKLDQGQSIAGDSYVFTRNEDYWNKDSYPYDQVKIKLTENSTAVLNSLRSGQVQGALAGTADLYKGAKDAGLNVTTYTTGSVSGLWLWDREGKNTPALADVRVRQAINHAMDRETIVKTLGAGRGKATVQIFGPDTGAYDESLENAYPYDLDKAKKLMADAGYANGFSMTLPDFSPVFPDAQAAMTEAFTALGIKADYQPITGDQVVGSVMGGKWPLNYFTLTSSGAWDSTQQSIAPEALFNPFHVNDPKIVELLNKARTGTGDAQNNALRDLNKHVVEQAWFAPWYFEEGAYASTNDVKVTPQANVSIPPLYNFSPAR